MGEDSSLDVEVFLDGRQPDDLTSFRPYFLLFGHGIRHSASSTTSSTERAGSDSRGITISASGLSLY